VRLFARLREVCDNQAVAELTLPEPATVADGFAALSERYPAAAPLREGLAAAINDEYAAWDGPLEDGDEVAFIPPVSGGMHAAVDLASARRAPEGVPVEEA